MNTLARIIGSLLAIAILVLLGWGMYIGIKKLGGLLAYLDNATAAILTVMAMVLLISAVLIALAIQAAARMYGNKLSNPDKILLYTKIIEALADTLKNQVSTTPASQAIDLSGLNKYMVLWGNNKVVKQYLQLELLLKEQPFSSLPVQQQIEKMLIEMRKDAGESNYELKQGDLIKLLSSAR